MDLTKHYLGHEPVAPALPYLREHLGVDVRSYRWLGDANPADLSTLHFGWTALMDDAPSAYNGESVPGYVANQYGDCPRFVEVPVVAWGDYCGDTVTRSNFRVLSEELAAWGVVEAMGGYGHSTLMLPAYAPVPVDILDGLIALVREYPLWDEGDHSELESELETEDWQSWARDDLRREMFKLVGSDDRLTDAIEALTDEELDSRAWAAISDGILAWEAETAVGGYFRGLDEFAASIVASL